MGSGRVIDESEVEPARLRPRPVCPARWGREKGYIAVRDPFTGEVHEILYSHATAVWKYDIRNLKRA